jgi:hypothetical protein
MTLLRGVMPREAWQAGSPGCSFRFHNPAGDDTLRVWFTIIFPSSPRLQQRYPWRKKNGKDHIPWNVSSIVKVSFSVIT